MEYDLERFIKAQKQDYNQALKEIKAGKKESHWMWYIFPQLDGLGQSDTSHYYGIKGIAEAKAYLKNDDLRNHLLEICNALLSLESNSAYDVFGKPDDYKLKSCMTLFAHATSDNEVFLNVLDKFYQGRQDKRTLHILNK